MNIDPVKAAFEANVTGFTGPVNQAIATLEKMISKLNKMGQAGNVAAEAAAAAARAAAAEYAELNQKMVVNNPFDPQDWVKHLTDQVHIMKTNRVMSGLAKQRVQEQRQQQEQANRVMSGLAKQKAQEEQRQQQQTNRVMSGLAKQKVQEETRQQREADRERRRQEKEEARIRRQMEKEEEQARRQFRRNLTNSGMGLLAGTAAGFNAGNPLLGALHGAVGGAFAGGPMGALAGGVAGTAGGGLALLTSGLGLAVELTKSLVMETVKLGMEYEKNTAFFTAFTGNKNTARGIMTGLEQTAVTSPFKFSELTGPAGLLMGYGISPENVTAAVSRLSMVAAGDSTRLQRLSLAFAQTQAHGKLMGQELRQFAESGVGAEDFAATLGISTSELKRRMKTPEGVSASVVADTINRLTNQGGRYAEVNQELLNSVEGRVNQLVETVQIKLSKAGAGLFQSLGVGNILAGITASIEPLANKYIPMVEEGLKNTLILASDLGGYLEKSLTPMGVILNDMVSSPAGKFFIPQTFDDLRLSLVGWAGSLGIAVGVMSDFARIGGTALDTMVAIGKASAAMTTGDYGSAVQIASAQSLMNNQVISDPFKYSELATKAFQDQMLEIQQDIIYEKLTGNRRSTPLEKLRAKGAMSSQPPAIENITVKQSVAANAVEAELLKIRERVLGGGKSGKAGGGKNLSKLEQFAKDMEDIARLSDLEAEANKLFPQWDPTKDAGEERRKKRDWLAANQLTSAQTEQARYNAYLQLKAGVNLKSSEVRLPSAVMADTAEAVRLQLEMSSQEKMNPQEEIRKVLEEAKRLQEEQLEEMKNLNKFLQDNPIILKPKKV